VKLNQEDETDKECETGKENEAESRRWTVK
jgi:hypothetical protein